MESTGLISPNIATFAVTILNITILYFLLRAILFKPVSKFMEARANKIQDAIDYAEKDKSQAKQLLVQYEERLKSADTKADEIIKIAHINAVHEAERIILDGKKTADIMLANARKQIENEHEAALVQFKTEAVMLILSASSKLIARDLQSSDKEYFVNMMLEELAKKRFAGKE
jgi:F-type H+-transporting ATPase subunit b